MILPCLDPYGLPPRGSSNSFKIISPRPVTFLPAARARNPFRIHTSELSCKCGKEKTYRIAKSFRFHTYKKQGGGVMVDQLPSGYNAPTLRPFIAPSIYPLCFQILAHSFAQRRNANTFFSMLLHTLSVATGGVPLQSPSVSPYPVCSPTSFPVPLSTFNCQLSALQVQSGLAPREAP